MRAFYYLFFFFTCFQQISTLTEVGGKLVICSKRGGHKFEISDADEGDLLELKGETRNVDYSRRVLAAFGACRLQSTPFGGSQ